MTKINWGTGPLTDEEAKRLQDSAGIARDGEVVRIPVSLMDGVQRGIAAQDTPTPGARSLPLDDAEIERRAAAYERKEKALGDAWRNPPPIDQGEFRSGSAPDEGDRYAARDARLCTRWRDAL